MIAELIKIGVIKKQLGDYKIRPGLDLFSKMNPIYVFAFFAGDVTFRESSDANGEPTQFVNKLDELVGELKTARSRLKGPPAWRIASQGQNIVHAERLNFTK